VRRTARQRAVIAASAFHPGRGFPLTDPAARRWWSAVLGPGAVADLLRLATAARSDRSLPRPVHLELLARHGLVRHRGHRIEVISGFPAIPREWLSRLHPQIRREHAASPAASP
jgi:hypothetical protein